MAKPIGYTVDRAHDITDDILAQLEIAIAEQYAIAEEEIAETLEDYLDRYAKKEAIWLEAVADGKKTQQEYEKWKTGQMIVGGRWAMLKDTIAHEMTRMNQITKEIAFGVMPTIYALNFNYGTYQVEKASGINTLFTLHNKDAVALLFDKEDKLYHDAGIKLSRKIALNKDLEWNKQQIQSIMLQGILQGESIPHLATRLQNNASQPFSASDIKDAHKKTAEQVAREVAEKNRNAAIRNVRSMTTYVENKGRENAYRRASEEIGVDGLKVWAATYDNRTRHAHRVMNGQKVPIDESFKYEGYEILEPGDPNAPGFLYYNCRCRLEYEFKGFERKRGVKSYYDEERLGMTYDQWVNAKPVSQRITHQEEVGEAMKWSYVAEYRRMKRKNAT